jgi:peptidoglycan/LPS O-acetylase OafA/YrhL
LYARNDERLATHSSMTDVAPRRRVDLTHVDGLDGLRGLAVIAVVLFHGGFSWASGGFLGVELFFVLSGFLITSLLLREWLSSGTVVLSNFWARRGRRLLPALFVLVVVIGIYYAIKGQAGAVPGLFGNGMSALFYYSNWHQIATGASYFAQNSSPSPFQHTWSLAIEEQFYVVWPLLVLAVAGLIVRGRRGPGGTPSDAQARRLLDTLLALSVLLLIASAVDAVLLYHGGSGKNRVYFGTDTRAYGLLSGAALAAVMARLRLADRSAVGGSEIAEPAVIGAPGSRRRRLRLELSGGRLAAVSLGSLAVVVALLVLMWKANGDQHWMYPWGFLVTDALGVALIAVIMLVPRAIANRVFSLAPLRYVGQISYGLYLWHYPLFLWIEKPETGLSGVPLFLVRVAAALAVSVLSYYLVEQPIRQRRWPVWIVRGLAPVSAGAGVVALALAASAAAIPTVSVSAPKVSTRLTGTGSCQVTLSNTPSYGAVAPPKADEGTFQIKGLDHGSVTWPAASATTDFRTCPPKRALMVGDSIAFTAGVPMLYDEADYGTAVADAAILGCAFGVRGELDVSGTWEAPPAGCPNELNAWAAEANEFKANEIIILLGYRDEFNWKWNGKIVHLGETAFDNYVEGRMQELVKVLGEHGRRKLLFLSIPYVQPAALPDGSPAPQGTSVRHDEINALIRQAAATDGSNASVLNTDTTLSPDGHYTSTVNGQECRLGDGIHPTTYCSELLEPRTFTAARALLDHKPAATH